MTTRLEIRDALRIRLEDPAAGLWTDAQLNQAIAEAITAYALQIPRRRSSTLALVAGTHTYTLPADCLHVSEILDSNNYSLTERNHEARAYRSPWATSLTWHRLSDTEIRFTPTPTAAQTLTIRYTAPRTAVNDDVSAQPIEPGDHLIVTAMAEAIAWTRRAAADGKRGSASYADDRAASARAEAAQLIVPRTRIARGGTT